MKNTALVGERGQVTVPKVFRRMLGIQVGTRLVFEVKGGELRGRKVTADDPLEALVGLGGPARTDAALRRLRGAPYSPARDGKPR